MSAFAGARRIATCALLAAATVSPLVAGGPSRAAAVDLVPVPFPSLEGLEPVVAEQLRSVRARLESRPAGESGAAALFGEAGAHYHAYELHAPAEACYRNAAALDPGDYRWPYLLGVLYEQQNRLDDAAAALARALEPADKYYPALVRLARVELQRGRLEQAAAALGPARRHASQDPALLAVAGELALARGRHEDAARDLRAALEAQPLASRLHYPLGLAYRALGRLEEARAHLARAGSIGVQPRDAVYEGVLALRQGEKSYMIEGHEAYRAGDHAAAARAYARAFEASGSRSVAALVNQSAAEAGAGRPEAALSLLEQARRLEPDAPKVLYNLGALLLHAGRPAEAAATLARLVERTPDDAEARVGLGLALLAAGRAAEALDRIDPLRAAAGQHCAELLRQLAQLAARAGEPLASRAHASHARLSSGAACALP